MHDAFLILHLIGVAIWLGGNAVLAFAGPRTPAASQDTRLWWAETQGVMARILYNVAGILVLVTGIVMVVTSDNDQFTFKQTWVSIGFLAVIVGAALGMAVFGPGSRKLAEAIRTGDTAGEKAINNKLAAFGLLDTLVVVFTIVAMVTKLGN